MVWNGCNFVTRLDLRNGVLPPCKAGSRLSGAGSRWRRSRGWRRKESGGCKGGISSGDGGGWWCIWGRGLLWNVGVLVVVFRKQVGSYRSRRQGQSRRQEEGKRADEKEQAKSSKGEEGKKRRGGPQRVVYDYEWGETRSRGCGWVFWVASSFFFFSCAQFSLFLVTLSFGGGVWILRRSSSRADYFSFAAP
ncbi:hypothetical protein BDP55DRAFT_326739 [Colletotrichum godetiae]|uniref:Transmembrane protein n=1 Tax=Colletotrichum godetiae TaxID=1209918 RepID=A0AAJ0ESZ7_9PEZI|nr:uncharacterized protein BDP55DRAFT_326739 [Colletotrichum godetiae]KAK1659988.1 hypothetical protein BDP55DRAFT_326739 [Colletotrichum godetiae]